MMRPLSSKLGRFLGILVMLLLVYTVWTYTVVRRVAEMDEAGPADAILVLGAAQYNGQPSPVFQARLDHAVTLFGKGYANVVITTGSYGPDPNFSEAQVGADYLSELGIDASQIVTDQGSGTTYDTVAAVSGMMDANGWDRVVAVSDGFHLYRLKILFENRGIDARTSPVPSSPLEARLTSRAWFSLREVALVSLYRVAHTFGLQ